MDFIHGLLIMEDDLDDEIGSNEESVLPTPGTSTEEQLALACTSDAATPDPGPPPVTHQCCPSASVGYVKSCPRRLRISVVHNEAV